MAQYMPLPAKDNISNKKLHTTNNCLYTLCCQHTVIQNLPYYTRGIQKVRRPTQLTTRYAHHILLLFNIDTCSWNALGPAFL